MSDPRNTAITYLYRDGSNYKVDHTVVFSGPITLHARDRLLAGLLPPDDPDGWGSIIPGQVGLPDLQNRFYLKEIRVLEALLAPSEGPVGLQIETAERERLEALKVEMRATLPQWRETDDHIFHEVTDISLTEHVPTDPRGIDAFIEEVSATEWDKDWKPVFYDEMVANYAAASAEEGPDP
jgi:hypothetical protein